MRLLIHVKPNARQTAILSENPLTIAVAAPPEKNKANKELLKFLKRQYKRKARIVKGLTSTTKLIELS